jgi:hypothetical protein
LKKKKLSETLNLSDDQIQHLQSGSCFSFPQPNYGYKDYPFKDPKHRKACWLANREMIRTLQIEDNNFRNTLNSENDFHDICDAERQYETIRRDYTLEGDPKTGSRYSQNDGVHVFPAGDAEDDYVIEHEVRP